MKPPIRTFGSPPPTDRDAGAGEGRWRVPEETPVAFIYNDRNYAVMLATPADLADFAVGFSLTERVVGALVEIEAIDIHQEARGVDIRMTLAARSLERFDARQQRRNLVGRAGCGVCGVENAETFFEALPQVRASKAAIDEAALMRAARDLERHQPLNARTHTVHAAAFAAQDGAIMLAREDVGRHNALDKLVGAMALRASALNPPHPVEPARLVLRDALRAPQDEASGRLEGSSTLNAGGGFVVISSRCSYEIVEKAARAGVGAILSLSAPTAFAIKKAEEANMALYVISAGRAVAIGR